MTYGGVVTDKPAWYLQYMRKARPRAKLEDFLTERWTSLDYGCRSIESSYGLLCASAVACKCSYMSYIFSSVFLFLRQGLTPTQPWTCNYSPFQVTGIMGCTPGPGTPYQQLHFPQQPTKKLQLQGKCTCVVNHAWVNRLVLCTITLWSCGTMWMAQDED